MICMVCGIRWADFPEEDFEFIPGIGHKPKNDQAESKREMVFEDDSYMHCGCNDEFCGCNGEFYDDKYLKIGEDEIFERNLHIK